MLDIEQRKAILIDEDYNMIIAGAGSGKTTTISAKVKYLVEKLNVKEEEIVVISFTNKAVSELKERINRDFNLNILICTFHHLAISLVKDKKSVCTNSYDILKYFFYNVLYNDNETLNLFLKYYKEYINVPLYAFNFKSINEFIEYKSKFRFIFLNDELNKNFNMLTTINGIKVNSIDELLICNHLFINGISFKIFDKYIKIYQDNISINLKIINNNIELFKNKLLNKFILFKLKKDYINDLNSLLLKYNFKLNKKSNSEIYKTILDTSKDCYLKKFISFCDSYIKYIKIKDIDIENIKTSNIKEEIFIKFIKKLYIYYTNYLKENNLIDFEDMINNATNSIDKTNYKYIIIDEYQDISYQRFLLIKKISDTSNSKIIAVGDDFQAIYSFSGSEVNLFLDFKKILGYCSLSFITNTYRNSKELIDIAGSFVMQDKSQIKKELNSSKHLKYPIILVKYKNCITKLNYCISKIVEEYPNKNILILGRYNFDINPYLGKYFKLENNKVKSLLYPNLDIKFLSVHSSKGLGYDNVIIINCNSLVYGFPSNVKTDDLLNLISIKSDILEERRLFYVALTRTKNKVYILYDEKYKSPFVSEIEKYKNVLIT